MPEWLLEALNCVLVWLNQWGEWTYAIVCLIIGGLSGWFLTWNFYKKTRKTQKEELETEIRKRTEAEDAYKKSQDKCAEYLQTIDKMRQYCDGMYIQEALTPDLPDKAVTAILNGNEN